MSAPAPLSPLDEIAAEVQGRGSICTVGPFLTTLSDDRLAAISIHVDRQTPLQAIGRTVQKWGYGGTASTVARHLAGRCSCPQ